MKGRVGVRPGLVGKLVTAFVAMLCVGLLILAGASLAAEQGKLAVSVAENTSDPTGGTMSIKTIDPSGTPIGTLVSLPAIAISGSTRLGQQLGSVSWSPDGSTLAYYQLTGAVRYQINATTSTIIPVASASGIFLSPGGQLLPWDLPNQNMNWVPAWSPTGEEIAYWAYTPQGQVLRTIHPDGSGMRTVAGVLNPAGASQVAWSPDGKTIAFSSAPGFDQVGNLLKVPAAGGTVSYLALPDLDRSFVGQPAYSPDGKSIAFIRQRITYPYTTPAYRRLVIRDLATGAERTVTDTYVSQAPTKVSWSPDGERIAYIEAAPACGVGGPAGCDLLTIKTDGTDKQKILHADYIGSVAWAGRADVKVTIDTPTAGQEITGHESTPAEKEAVRLTGTVSPATDLSGWCFEVQAPGEGEPPTPSKADCNRPFDSSSNGGVSGRFSADLYQLVRTDLEVGDNTVWVWGYGPGQEPGVAKVAVKVRPNYFIKHVEVTQAISPDLGSLNGFEDPLAEGARDIDWSLPNVGNYNIPLVAGKRTLLRIYVGDSQLGEGKDEQESAIGYTVTGGGLAAPLEGETEYRVKVTAPDLDPDDYDPDAAINVWLPAEAAAAGTRNFHVKVNPDQQTNRECTGCFPNGNEADLTSVQFEQGGGVTLVPVDVEIRHGGKVYRPTVDYSGMLGRMPPVLPISDDGLRVLPSQGSVTIIPIPQGSGVKDRVGCWDVLIELQIFRLLHPPPTGTAGVVRWVGLASPPPDVAVDCGGFASPFTDNSFVLFSGGSNVNLSGTLIAVHELGHTLSLWHVPGLNRDAVDAFLHPLPYSGIGGVGHDPDRPRKRIDKTTFSDLMSYSQPQWTSPQTWQRMFEEILGRSGGPLAVPSVARASSPPLLLRPATAPRGPAPGPATRRRLVGGVVFGEKSYIYKSLVADARAPKAKGPVAARLVGLDRNGHEVADVPIRGKRHVPFREAPPFLVSLPASDRIVALELRSASRRKVLDKLKASDSTPKGGFLRLRRHARAGKPFAVRWRATDADNNSLTVTLLARRGGAWQPLATGPAAFHARLRPWTLGRGKKLRLRLLISDGFNTSTVKAKAVRLRCTPRVRTGGIAVPAITAPSAATVLRDRSRC